MLDTNVLISGFAYPVSVPGKLVELCRTGGLDLVLSRYILDELKRVLPRIKQARLTADDIGELVDSLYFLADVVEPSVFKEPKLRDLADNPILGTLLAGHADFLVTGDKDLLVLVPKYPIVTPAEFWAQHG